MVEIAEIVHPRPRLVLVDDRQVFADRPRFEVFQGIAGVISFMTAVSNRAVMQGQSRKPASAGLHRLFGNIELADAPKTTGDNKIRHFALFLAVSLASEGLEADESDGPEEGESISIGGAFPWMRRAREDFTLRDQ